MPATRRRNPAPATALGPDRADPLRRAVRRLRRLKRLAEEARLVVGALADHDRSRLRVGLRRLTAAVRLLDADG